MKNIKLKFDLYLSLIFVLIITVYNAPYFAYIPIIPILLISYYRLIVKRDITTVLILMLIARLIMGPFIIHNDLAYNISNILCNYLPVTIIIGYSYFGKNGLDKSRFLGLKYTIVYLVFLLLLSFLTIKYAISVFPKEILPLLLFTVLMLVKADKKINYFYLLKFFRYAFLASLIIYINPNFGSQIVMLANEQIIFKEEYINIINAFIRRTIPRNTGFIYDFRIMGQFACVYLLLLYYLGKKRSYIDVILLVVIAILTFSRGPIVLLVLLLFGIYVYKQIKLTKRVLVVGMVAFAMLISGVIYIANNDVMQKYLSTYNPLSEDSAISQRGMFLNYSWDKFKKHPLGNGIGSLSSPKAGNKIYAGITNLHKAIPDKVYYYAVTDAYLAMSLAEKGIIGFILMLISFSEIFFSNKNKLSLFFLIGFYINLIGTDIPKEGFFYFVILMIYYGASQLYIDNNASKTENERIH